MRHDESPRAMITRLFDLGQDFYRLNLGYQEIILPWQHAAKADGDSEAHSMYQRLSGVAKYTRRGSYIGLGLMREIIKREGWQDDITTPLDSYDNTPVMTRWLGFDGEGAPIGGEVVPLAEPADTFEARVEFMLDTMWRAFKISERYRRHQTEVVEAAGDSWPLGADAWLAYQNYQAQLSAAIECISKAAHQYSLIIGRDLSPNEAHVLAGRHLRLPDVVDIGYERDWASAPVVSLTESLL